MNSKVHFNNKITHYGFSSMNSFLVPFFCADYLIAIWLEIFL
uniref:Uncharacterized protein n=1 Tax=Rhizophora mucronata TaxID=61149 RepID=A0A2P2PD11_RHIMU